MEATAEKVSASAMATDQITKLRIQIRDRRASLKAQYEREDADLKLKDEKLGAILLTRLREQGAESMRTAHGTIYIAEEVFASVADKEALKQHVVNHDAWELLTLMANRASVKQYVEDNGDAPPGVNIRKEISVRVRRT